MVEAPNLTPWVCFNKVNLQECWSILKPTDQTHATCTMSVPNFLPIRSRLQKWDNITVATVLVLMWLLVDHFLADSDTTSLADSDRLQIELTVKIFFIDNILFEMKIVCAIINLLKYGVSRNCWCESWHEAGGLCALRSWSFLSALIVT